jgi:hypothetical protein
MIRDVAIHRLLAGLGSSVPFSPEISIFQKREEKKLPRYSGIQTYLEMKTRMSKTFLGSILRQQINYKFLEQNIFMNTQIGCTKSCNNTMQSILQMRKRRATTIELDPTTPLLTLKEAAHEVDLHNAGCNKAS